MHSKNLHSIKNYKNIDFHIVNNKHEFSYELASEKYNLFIDNVNKSKYNPRQFIEENLSLEKCEEKLLELLYRV